MKCQIVVKNESEVGRNQSLERCDMYTTQPLDVCKVKNEKSKTAIFYKKNFL